MKSFFILTLAALSMSTPAPLRLEQDVAVSSAVSTSSDPSQDAGDSQDSKRNVARQAGYWSCSVPSDSVYTAARNVLNSCGAGSQKQYFVVPPSDNLLAWFTYTSVRESLSPCDVGRPSRQYKLRKPVAGLVACTVPGTFTYKVVRSTYNTCAVDTYANVYTLINPADKMEACTVPDGFVYTKVRTAFASCSANGNADIYTIRAPSQGLGACNVPEGWGVSTTRSVYDTCRVYQYAPQYVLTKK
ncbi:hypothetical protein CSHISOI_05359, partial [Colletotrichum shisoi]